jgi:cyclohexyl-isocyanide hydratase
MDNNGKLTRRALSLGLPLAMGLSRLVGDAVAADDVPTKDAGSPARMKVAMLLYDDMILLDLTGPMTALALAMSDIHLVARSRNPVRTDVGIPVQPTMTFDECPYDLDVLFVPGGLAGSLAAMNDEATTAFLADRGNRARWVTSVCTGSLVLGAAGLLRGYKATSHWYVRELLPLMGAELVKDRIVTDRNRITGGGVTAGIDFGLVMVAQLRGEDYAKRIQLVLEYDPKPPFSAGSPDAAGPQLVQDVLGRRAKILAQARIAAANAGDRILK